MTILNPTIGPGLTVSLSIIGLMIGSIIIEHNGLFQVPKNKTTQLKIISVAVFTIGIIIIKVVG
ncbi:DMT family transporter [Weissella paramesenteroides]